MGPTGLKFRRGQGWLLWRLQGRIIPCLFQLLEAPHPWLAAPPASSQPAAQHLSGFFRSHGSPGPSWIPCF